MLFERMATSTILRYEDTFKLYILYEYEELQKLQVLL